MTAPALPAALPKVLRDREELFCRALAASGIDARDVQAVVTAYNAMRDADPSLDHPAELEQARPAPAGFEAAKAAVLTAFRETATATSDAQQMAALPAVLAALRPLWPTKEDRDG
jgi:hypothetical protein